MASSDIESLQNGLKTIKEIRSKTYDLWKSVVDGPAAKEDGHETKYLSEIKQKLDTVGAKIRNLENTANKHQSAVTHPLGHSLYLNIDSTNESFALYNSLITGYKWWGKAHDYAGGAASFLGQNSLNRSSGKVTKPRRRPPNTSYAVPPSALDTLINRTSSVYSDMKFRISRPNGTKSSAIVEVSLDRLLEASMIFKGLMVEWVMVRGFGETANCKDTRAEGMPDVWTESKYIVFKRITDNANAAMLNFQSPVYPELAAKSFFTYLHSFASLFTDKCKSCGYHLRNNIPPTWREFKTLDPYHEDCRP